MRALVFDAFGTLFDVHSIALTAEAEFPGQGRALSELWRDKQIEYSRIRTLSGRYVPFSRVTEDALVFALRRLGLSDDTSARLRLIEQYARLESFPENLAALRKLLAMGISLAILSNGDPPMLEAAIRHAGFDGLFEYVLSADTTRCFKTSTITYALATQAYGCLASELLFVSSNAWDVCGASWCGYRTFWINRTGQPAEELGVAMDGVGKTMDDVVAYVAARTVRPV